MMTASVCFAFRGRAIVRPPGWFECLGLNGPTVSLRHVHPLPALFAAVARWTSTRGDLSVLPLRCCFLPYLAAAASRGARRLSLKRSVDPGVAGWAVL